VADTKISGLSAVGAVIGSNEIPVNEAGTSKKATVTQLAAFLNASPTFTGVPTTTTPIDYDSTTQVVDCRFVQKMGRVQVIALAGDATENETTSMVAITGLTLPDPVPPGSYAFQYYLRVRTVGDAANSVKFAVNHDGGATLCCYNLYWPSTGTSAATGTMSQEQNNNTGSVWAFVATRVMNTTLGPQVSLTTDAADTLFVIEGMIVLSDSGSLILYHGSELAQTNGTQVKAGSCLILTRLDA
jgi:hypothetical protein